MTKKLNGMATAIKMILALAIASLLAPAAFAQSQTYYLDNSVRTMNALRTEATITGVGSVTAHGEAKAAAAAAGVVQVTPNSFTLQGAVSGSNTGAGYVITSGAGNGNVNLDSFSDARVFGNVGITQPYGHLNADINVDGGMQNAVRNGTDLKFNVNNNQDVFGAATYAGTAAVVGVMTQVPVVGGAVLNMAVSDSKTVDGTLDAGRITFTGTAPTGMSAGTVFGRTGVEVIVNANGHDPVGQ